MTGPTGAPTVLEVRDVTAGYGRTVVLRNVSVVVPAGGVVALLGPNGAGKTTLMRTAAGLIKPVGGRILLAGEDLTESAPNRRSRKGLCLIPEGRGVFRELSVRDNLRISRPAGISQYQLDAAIEYFPILGRRLGQLAGSMSGGEQQMLALARAFVTEPAVVLLDEVSMGLAPVIVDRIFESLRVLRQRGVAVLLVEQYVERALAMADSVVLLDRGMVSFAGPPADLDQEALVRYYLGGDEASVSHAYRSV